MIRCYLSSTYTQMKDLKEKNDFKVTPSSLPLLKGDLRGMFSPVRYSIIVRLCNFSKGISPLPPLKATLSTHLVNIYRRGGLNPPEPTVTTLGVMHKVNRFRADSICPYGG